MNILYSYNKKGFEAEFWHREISAASRDGLTFIPFNHDPYLPTARYIRAQLLDNLYFARDANLLRMYADMEAALRRYEIDALIVGHCPPYHPDFLRRLSVQKVLWMDDGPLAFYDRGAPYLHAYDQILYNSPAHSPEMTMAEKMEYCGVAKKAHFCPLAIFDTGFDTSKTEETILASERDIEIVFIGAMHVNKMPLLAKVKKAYGRRCRMHGLTSIKRNAYFNARFGFPGWIRTAAFEDYIPLYQRAKIGFNMHNRGDYSVGGYRLFELPANGVMQISDGGDHLSSFFEVGEEVVRYRTAEELIELIQYYLDHDAERERIAMNGYRRVLADHRFRNRMRQVGRLITERMARQD